MGGKGRKKEWLDCRSSPLDVHDRGLGNGKPQYENPVNGAK